MGPVRSLSVCLLLLLVTLGVESVRLPADVGSLPHTISLRRNGQHVCGAALINAKWALTAAHCVSLSGGQQSYPPRSYTVRCGSIQRLVGGQLLPLSQIIIHKNYSSSGSPGANDLALLELQTPVTLNTNTQPIALAEERAPAGSQVSFAGWGSSAIDGSPSHALQVATRVSLSKEECDTALYLEQEDLLCLSPSTEDTDLSGLCSGDAGAPAVYNNQLVGIGSFFAGGCGSGQPDGYVDVTQHLDWITENTA
ncbi:hypothetical protein KR067_002208 [Drosophila pandora]|nr:hypothetical protein KR067_002208 [Drosophila pandora]